MISTKKELARSSSQLKGFISLRHLSSCNSDDADGGGSSGARSSMKGLWNSRSTDTVGSIHMDNSRIHNPDSHNSCIDRPDNQIQFRLKPARLNAARGPKPIRLPSMQLTGTFNCSIPFLFVVS
jgi:hypothetical protein